MTGLVLASSLETESQQIFEKNWGFKRGTKIFILTNFYFKSVTKVWDIGAHIWQEKCY
jgi:hypothetical protein